MSETVYQDLCLVERILQKRIDQETGSVEYLIRWQGTDAQGNEYEDTWEPEQNILGDELIDEFERKQQQLQSSKRPQHQRTPSKSKGVWREGGEAGQDSTQRGQAPPPPGVGHPFDQHASSHPPGYFPPPYISPYGHPNFPGSRQPPISNLSPYNTRTTKRKLPSAVNNEREVIERPSTQETSISGNVKRQKVKKKKKRCHGLASILFVIRYFFFFLSMFPSW